MAAWLAGRLLQAFVVLAIMSFVIYALIGLMPGDPVDIMIAADPRLAPEDAARLRALYGLDLPIGERYLNWLGTALSGDLGYSRTYNRPVLEILLPRLANTLLLLGIAALLAISMAVTAGIVAALRPRGIVDAAINLACFAGISVPPFWLALVLIIVFAVTLGWLPAGGMGEAGAPWGERAAYLVLPVATLTAASLAAYTRFARSAMIEALRQDWIRTARAKGAGPARVVAGHALRNAMLPLVTIIALDFGTLFSGALITETMFGWLGMGKLIYDSILGNDFNTALVALLFATGVVLVANVLADIAYAALDPRISYRAQEAAR